MTTKMTMRFLALTVFLVIGATFAAGWQGKVIAAVNSSRIVEAWGFVYEAENGDPPWVSYLYGQDRGAKLMVGTKNNKIASSTVQLPANEWGLETAPLMFGSHWISATGMRFDSPKVEAYIKWAESVVKSKKRGTKRFGALTVEIKRVKCWTTSGQCIAQGIE
jgi:hypothetical protein